MSILAELPELSIINGFKGVLDFYVYMGLPCCRTWPGARSVPWTQAQKDQWLIFQTASRLWNYQSSTIREATSSQASPTTMSGRDLSIKLYINATTIYPGLGTYAYQ